MERPTSSLAGNVVWWLCVDYMPPNESFKCNGALVPKGQIPVTLVTELSFADLMETELEENILREELPWQDRMRALAAIHQQRCSENPSQTKTETARELAEKGSVGSATTHRGVRHALTQALIISDKLDDPKIAKARNAKEAQALILKAEEERLLSALARRRLASTGGGSDGIKIRHGDLFDILPALAEGHVDLVLTDPPYGIGAGSAGFRGRAVHHHNYDDTPELATRVAQTILAEGFRVCKQRGNLFLFAISKGGLNSARWLLEWDGKCFRVLSSGRKASQKDWLLGVDKAFAAHTDALLYATKGGRGLITSPCDILTVKRVPRNLRLHAAEKPVELLHFSSSALRSPATMSLTLAAGSVYPRRSKRVRTTGTRY